MRLGRLKVEILGRLYAVILLGLWTIRFVLETDQSNHSVSSFVNLALLSFILAYFCWRLILQLCDFIRHQDWV